MLPEKKESIISNLKKCASVLSNGFDSLYLDEDRVENVFVKYNSLNGTIHNIIADKEFLMDRHKIASSFFISIVSVRPIVFNQTVGKKYSHRERTVNEQLAFTIALYIINSFNKEDAKTDDEKVIHSKGIQLPECTEGTYLDHFLKLILNNKTKFNVDNNEFEDHIIFFISNYFYLIDKYSYQYWKSILIPTIN